MGSSDDTKTEKKKKGGEGNKNTKNTVLMFAWSAHLIKNAVSRYYYYVCTCISS